jgi:hypothetical protein
MNTKVITLWLRTKPIFLFIPALPHNNQKTTAKKSNKLQIEQEKPLSLAVNDL